MPPTRYFKQFQHFRETEFDSIRFQFAAVDRLEKAIESIQSTIEDLGGSLVIKMKPKAISESEEQDLAQLMAKAGQENVEVSGDEDEEDEGL